MHGLHTISQLNPVKLNDPLMGTETYTPVILGNAIRISSVKLNDPLMGTETSTQQVIPMSKS